MNVNGIADQLGMARLEGAGVDMRAAARALTASTVQENNSRAAHPGTKESRQEEPFDLFKAIGTLFDGSEPQSGDAAETANKFDLGALLSSIFEGASKEATQRLDAPKPQAHHAKGQEQVSISGEVGDARCKASGKASAEAHVKADAFGESFAENGNFGVRGGAEASVGASAEAQGRVQTDLGSIDGHAKVSAEVYARIYGEARAGAEGLCAASKAEVGAMARGEADTNIQIANGLVGGHADAHAEAGAGAQATARSAISFNPPEAIVRGKAESFAGARAGYSAKGGVAGLSYGVQAELWAGAGAKAEINGGLDQDGKFQLSFSLGIAAGVGAMVKFNVEFDTKVFGKVASDLIGTAGDIVGGVLGAVFGIFDGGTGKGAAAGKAISGAVRKVAPMLGKMLGTVAKKEFDAAKPEVPAGTQSSSIESSSVGGTLAQGTL